MSMNLLDQVPVGEIRRRMNEIMKQHEVTKDEAAIIAICVIDAELEIEERDKDKIEKQDVSPVWTQLGIDALPDKLTKGPLANKGRES